MGKLRLLNYHQCFIWITLTVLFLTLTDTVWVTTKHCLSYLCDCVGKSVDTAGLRRRAVTIWPADRTASWPLYQRSVVRNRE